MARIKSEPGATDAPRIDRAAVETFFAQRAVKAQDLGPLRAVIYQDKHPDLAERRDRAEKAALLPRIALTSVSRVLDLGCGTGRWTPHIADICAHYHGVDFAEGLVRIANEAHGARDNVRFTTHPVDAVSMDAIGETEPFDRIVMFGVLIYMNDEEVANALDGIAAAAASTAQVLIREPVALGARLTIKEHHSDDMEQSYNAIYRTADELTRLFEERLAPSGFSLVASGDVYTEAELNNRADTRQQWFCLTR
jgi:cyclopropane fatty-acyl-phospholipid synthase-like methyltransferase